MSKRQILVTKASVNNLKGIDVAIPHGVLCCLTGVSGSGKSSFAFDTLFVEGQRRYVQSLSNQAKRIIGHLPKPEVESISGLTPTIAIEQKTTGGSPRSTVATLTEIYEYLRVLYSKLAVPHCPDSGVPLSSISRKEMIEALFSRFETQTVMILAPMVHQKKGALKEELRLIEQRGFTRIRLDGAITRVSETDDIDPSTSHTLDIVVDRVTVNSEHRQRLVDSLQTALEIGKGIVIVTDPRSGDEELFSEHAYSRLSGKSYPPLEPGDFSFNSPSGMCPECQGLGECHEFVQERIFETDKSLVEDCCSVAGSYQTVYYRNIYDNLASLFNFSVNTPWKELSQEAQTILLYGTPRRWTRMSFINPTTGATWVDNVQWRGIIHEAKKKYHAAKSARYKRDMEALMHLSVCHQCHGSRLKPYPSAAKLRGVTIHELMEKTIDEAFAFFDGMCLNRHEAYATEAVEQVRSRLSFLQNVGLGYLTLNRMTSTLSGGEFQRVRLASQMGSSLVGITYILDEPSIGLHPHDSEKLFGSLKELQNRGNTVIVVEHDDQMMKASDWIIDFGRGAGTDGGEILYQGPVHGLEKVSNSVTSDYLFGRRSIPVNQTKRTDTEKQLSLLGVSYRNMHNLDLYLPLERFIALTGVSGSGKSSLIFDTLSPALSNLLTNSDLETGHFDKLTGHHYLDRVRHIDQTPIGRTPRSNPATYSGVFDEIRTLFACLPESKARGYTPGQFSFNLKAGVCPVCSGMGVVGIEMDFLEQAWVPCTACGGKRYDDQTLSIRYKGKSILDVLNMTCQEALIFFESIPAIRSGLETLCRVGLNYIHLGQSATTLSGGEAQRLKIARELAKPAQGKTLYLLDEPTTGLHAHDVTCLLDVLHTLVARGNTVLVIEHNMELVKTAEYVIDMGPGAGIDGGKIIATGHPLKMAQLDSPTGRALKKAIAPSPLPPSRPSQNNSEQQKPEIRVVGAGQHTLKDLSFSLPKEALIALIGPSGSGKSSLAFETLFAEGQRQYIESLPTYARHFIKQMQRPFLETVHGLPPAIAITQREHASNPRSTVGTMTEIYDSLRIYWAHYGVPHCPTTGAVIRPITKEYVADTILSWEGDSPVYIAAPIQTKGVSAKTVSPLIESFQKMGYSRFRLNGKIFDISREEIPKVRAGRKVSLEVIIDRLRPVPDERQRLTTSIEEAARLGGNQLVVLQNDLHNVFNLSFSVAETGESFPQITSHTFSFTSAQGMCLSCRGTGIEHHALLIQKSPFDECDGSFLPDHGHPCSACGGTRLNPLARHVTINEISIADACRMPMNEMRQFLRGVSTQIPHEKALQRALDEADRKLGLAEDVGIGYLSLDRCAGSLSSGEAQRVRLISQIGSQLSDLLYVLDEPTTGLHPQDTERLMTVLNRLKSLGNTVLVVEHDPQLIDQADHILELGPCGGADGGQIVFQDSVLSSNSPTGRALNEPFVLNDGSSLDPSSPSLKIQSASCHNLKNFTCVLPTEALIGIVGVSGSGKSTLLNNVLQPAMAAELEERPEENCSVLGLDHFERLVVIDQKPISHTTRSDLSTYMELSSPLRQFFAELPSAKAMGCDAASFSAYHRRGMCKQCSGLGEIRIDMHFLPPVRVPCDGCGGLRLNPASLSVEYRGKNLGQILKLPVECARKLFEGHRKITRCLDSLVEVGLQYVPLGAEMVSLSSGEAQRAKLAKELAKSRKKRTLYLMDEPMTGLHIQEVRRLMAQLHILVNEGHTVIVVEHNIDAVALCDHLVELGPGAGSEGGKVVATGSPASIAKRARTPTGKFLRERMQR